MRPKRKSSGGGVIAFIDVMACGLGAVVLLLVIVDFNIEEILPNPAPIPTPLVLNNDHSASTTILSEELVAIKRANDKISRSIAALTTSVLEAEIQKAELASQTRVTIAPIKLDTKRNASGELIGIKVNGASIIILLDTSSSMFSEIISDNIYYAIAPSKSASDRSAKWRQAKRIAKWLVNVAPYASEFKIAEFAEETTPLSIAWQSQQQAGIDLASKLEAGFPEGGTDLRGAFNWLDKAARSGTQVFLITDGLPTRLPDRSAIARLFSACSNDPKGFVSGECRLQIFSKSVEPIASAEIELNVILLPLEGDPKAAPALWALAKSKRGMLFVPEGRWP